MTIQMWRPVQRRNYIVRRGDVLTLRGASPQDVFDGDSEDGYVVNGYAGSSAGDLCDEYSESSEPTIWTKMDYKGKKIRLIPDKIYSKPLPLP